MQLSLEESVLMTLQKLACESAVSPEQLLMTAKMKKDISPSFQERGT